MPRVYIESYGCSNSQSEGETIAGLLEKAGFKTTKEKNADLLIIVTCYVKIQTQHKILHRMRQLQEKYPKKKMIISGCMPEGIYEKITKTFPEASLVSTHHVKDIVKAAEKTLEGKRVEYLGEANQIKVCLPKVRKNPVINIVPISSGCNSSCSYCCVRLVKGRLFSYPQDKIISEVKSSLKLGCKEVWITSQDNASYDNGKLPALMNDISGLPGDFFVRIGMMNPKNVIPILPNLIEAYRKEKVYKFLHLPIQSGDDEVLKRMNRGHKVKDFEKIVSEFGKNFRYQLWTDIIVGFPGETEKQFQNTFRLIKKVKPDWVNVSRYGPRPNTLAAKMKMVDSEAMNRRSSELSELVRNISLEKNKEWVGWKGRILISKKGNRKDQWYGRNYAYKPFIVEAKGNNLGKWINVEAVSAERAFVFADRV
ncbi:MAG: tRNA (N(6)-L-threonylcarbamoyladenosine(37)-C(2))-methylthiotransferase [Candidatus Aenigmatarchaeota archaeon]